MNKYFSNISLVLLLATIFIVTSGCKTSAQFFNAEEKKASVDSLPPAVIEISPRKLIVPMPEGKYFSGKVEVFNRGGQPLVISKIKSSCFCANGKALLNNISSLEIGEIYLTVNLEDITTNNLLEFTIHSNARNSPFVYTVEFTDRVEKEDDSMPEKAE